MKIQKSKFRERIYKIVKKIPMGKTRNYKEVAFLIGRPKAWRAVGNILNQNKDPQIPCHRVVKEDGRVGGYRYGAKKKITLLKKEGIMIKNGKITPRFEK